MTKLKVYGYTSPPPPPPKFFNRDNFRDFLFVYLEDEVVYKWGLLLKERICSDGRREAKELLPLKVYPFTFRICEFAIYLPTFKGAIGWCDGPGYTSRGSAGASYTLDDSRARAYCACSKCGWGFVRTFLLSSIFSSLLFLPLFGRRLDID